MHLLIALNLNPKLKLEREGVEEGREEQARSAPEVTFNAICACTLSAPCLRFLLSPLPLFLSLYLCVCASLTFFFVLWFSLITDQKSILTDNDWKKLWMRGGINADSKLDNNLDSSDSPMFEDSEVSRTDRLADCSNSCCSAGVQ